MDKQASEQASRKQLSIEPLPGYPETIGRALAKLEDTRRRTLQALEGLAPEAIDWLPPEGGNTLGTLLYHLAAIELDWLYEDILAQPFPDELEALFPDDLRDDNGLLVLVRGVPLETHLSRLGKVRAELLENFRTVSEAAFYRPRALENYSVTPEWVLHHLMQHEAEHRGQIGALRARAELK